MSPGSSSRALLALAAVVLGGCATHEPETKPFLLKATVLLTGKPLADGYTEETIVDVTGLATREDAQNLLVREAVVTGGAALGELRISFDARGIPEAAFPASLSDKTVRIRVRLSPAGRGPNLEPLLVPGIRVLVNEGGERSVLTLFEGTYLRDRVARVVSPAAPTEDETTTDFPVYFVDEQWAEVEPGECGLAYYDRLVVGDPTDGDVLTVLGRGEKDRAIQIGSDVQPWTVAHAVSYHRDGACEDQSRVYTQLAAWRTPVIE